MENIVPGPPESSAASSGADAATFAAVDRGALSAIEVAEEEETLRPLGGREAWERFLSQIREAKLTLGIWLMSARVKALVGDRLLLSFTPQNRFAREMVLEEKNRRFIEFHLERFFGRKVLVETDEHVGAEAKPARPSAGRRRSSDPELDKLAGGAPVIKRLIEEFDGELYNEGT